MDTSSLNIYPLNEQNLQALLDYYFPFLPKGNASMLLTEIRITGLTLKDLEHLSEKILPFISFINERLKGNATQTNILDYSIEIFLKQDIDFYTLTPERIEIIKTVRAKAAIDQTYEEMPGKESVLFFYNNWN